MDLFSGLLICGSCGGNMTRKMVRHGDVVYRYYYCPTGKRNECSVPAIIKEDTLKEIVINERELAEFRDKKIYRGKGNRSITIKTIYGEAEYSRNIYRTETEERQTAHVYLLD